MMGDSSDNLQGMGADLMGGGLDDLFGDPNTLYRDYIMDPDDHGSPPSAQSNLYFHDAVLDDVTVSPSIAFATPSQPSPPSGHSSGSLSNLSISRTKSNASTDTSASPPATAAEMIPGDGTGVKSEWSQYAGQETLAFSSSGDGTIRLSSIENAGSSSNGPPEPTSSMGSPFSNPSPGGHPAPSRPRRNKTQRNKSLPVVTSNGLPSPDSVYAFGPYNESFQHPGMMNTSIPMSASTNTSREVSPYAGVSAGGPPADGLPTMVFNFQGFPSPTSVSPAVNSSWMQPGLRDGRSGFPLISAGQMSMFALPTPVEPRLCVNLDTRKNGAKSRVETQITVRIELLGLPPHVGKVHLPTYTMSKRKLLAKPTPEPSPDMLELHAVVVCTSAMQKPGVMEDAMQRARDAAQRGRPLYPPPPPPNPETDDSHVQPQDGGEVQICSNCIGRERKRADRKKNKHPENDSWSQDEVRRIIVFNTQEVKEWMPEGVEDASRDKYPAQTPLRTPKMHIEVPMRIACYCRHHSEKLGFQVIFTLTDHRFNVFAQTLSNSIMITDDHKAGAPAPFPLVGGPSGTTPTGPPNLLTDGAGAPSQPQRPDGHGMGSSAPPLRAMDEGASRKRPIAARVPPPETPIGQGRSPVIPTPQSMSRATSPSGMSTHAHKRRKGSNSARIPTGLAMTPIETRQVLGRHTPDPPAVLTNLPAVSPFSSATPTPYSASPDPPAYHTVAVAPATSTPPFITSPSTPAQELLFSGLTVYSNPTSTQQSRAPSPTLEGSQHPFSVRTLSDAVTANDFMPSSRPVINKVVPHEGPKSGGIEVSILGSAFENGMEVMFGEVPATTTTYWGPTTLVCLLPPAPRGGVVQVTLRFRQSPFPPTFPPALFRYVDNDEDQVIRTALAVLLDKYGNANDVHSFAKKVITSVGDLGARSEADMSSHQGQYRSHGSKMELEARLLKLLELIDLDDSPRPPAFNCRRAATGQTMLHMACSLGLQRFVAGLVARGGVLVNQRDKGGYTPLHMAALNNHHLIVRRLISCGADPSLRTLSGLTPEDLTKSPEVLQALRHVERHVHVRSRSAGPLISSPSSATSLRSLWEPPSGPDIMRWMPRREANPDTDGPRDASDPETSDDADAENEDETWLDMRRRASTHDLASEEVTAEQLRRPAAGAPGGLGLPTAAMAAFKEQLTAQVQQIQQMMALHLQNLPQFRQLPQFPYRPQMPNMPPLPEYQTAVLQKLAAMVPMRAASGSSEDQTPSSKDLEGRWWTRSAVAASTAPPPSYDEIFPQKQARALDTKQESAARAALEAEGDAKCAALFDTQEEASRAQPGPSETIELAESETSSLSQTRPGTSDDEETDEDFPTLLQIGRKNAITKEQQEQLRRAHAEKLKRLSRDRNLFFVWIPLLIIVTLAMAYNTGIISTARHITSSAFARAQKQQQGFAREV